MLSEALNYLWRSEKIGGGPPHSKTLREFRATSVSRQRLGVRLWRFRQEQNGRAEIHPAFRRNFWKMQHKRSLETESQNLGKISPERISESRFVRVKPIHAILLIAAFFVAGCDTLHIKQYRVAGVAPNSADAIRLKSVLQNAADKSGLKNRAADSSATNILFYAQDEYEWGISTLRARFYQDDVLLDLSGGFGTPPAYKQGKRLLPPALSSEFGSRFSILKRRVESQ
jgi:hypothetical protein